MVPLGLCKVCKGTVSQEAASCPRCGQPGPYQPLPDQVRILLASGRTLEAIKKIRELTGMDLKASKAFIESLQRDGGNPSAW